MNIEIDKTKPNKIAIIGHGFVGKATEKGFSVNTDIKIIDPKYNNSITDLTQFNPEICFVCVPTPMGSDGNQDSRIIEKVIDELGVFCPETIICVKSTVIPTVIKKIEKKNVIYNPEFLREKHAVDDFINSEMIVIGGDRVLGKKVSEFYRNNSLCKTSKFVFLDLISASIVKYSINTFLSTKVIFFNEIHDLFNRLNTGCNDSWRDITDAIKNDKRIGDSHMDVPGHDGRYGFGGACFPKDCAALLKLAEDENLELSVLKQAVKTNNKIRSQYETLDEREREQNVTYDKDV